MTDKFDKEILNSIQLHMILLNVATKAIQFKLKEKINQRDRDNINSVRDFLNLNSNFETIANINKTGAFTNNLDLFDIHACYKIASEVIALPLNELEIFKKAYSIHNDYYEKLHFLKTDDSLFSDTMPQLKEMIYKLCEYNSPFYEENRNKIKLIESIHNYGSLDSAYLQLRLEFTTKLLDNLQIANEIGKEILSNYQSKDKQSIYNNFRDLIQKVSQLTSNYKGPIPTLFETILKNYMERHFREEIENSLNSIQNELNSKILVKLEGEQISQSLESFALNNNINENQLKELLDLEAKSNGLINQEMADTYQKIGFAYVTLNNSKKAIDYIAKAIKTRENLFKNEINIELASLYQMLGTAYIDLDDYINGIKNQFMSLKIKEKLYQNHSDLALSYDEVSLTFSKLGLLNLALDYQNKNLDFCPMKQD